MLTILVVCTVSVLQGAVALLNAKTKLLEPAQLDQIEGRLQALGQKLGQIQEKKASVEQTDKDSKVNWSEHCYLNGVI